MPIVSAVGIAVSADTAERKAKLEGIARQAVMGAIAAAVEARTGLPSDDLLRQVQWDALRREEERERSCGKVTNLMFREFIRVQTTDVLVLALEMVKSVGGVMRVLRAEEAGLRRWEVLTTASRRLEQLEGTEAPGSRTKIIATAVLLEPGQV